MIPCLLFSGSGVGDVGADMGPNLSSKDSDSCRYSSSSDDAIIGRIAYCSRVEHKITLLLLVLVVV